MRSLKIASLWLMAVSFSMGGLVIPVAAQWIDTADFVITPPGLVLDYAGSGTSQAVDLGMTLNLTMSGRASTTAAIMPDRQPGFSAFVRLQMTASYGAISETAVQEDTELFSMGDDWIHLHRLSIDDDGEITTHDFSPPLALLPRYMRVGDRHTASPLGISFEIFFQKIETVTTVLGTFETAKFQIRVVEAGQYPVETTSWLARDIGEVKNQTLMSEYDPEIGLMTAEYSYQAVQASRPVSAQPVLGVWADLPPVHGLIESSWFGTLRELEFPWIWHSELGWHYCVGQTEDSLWFYSFTQGWWWTSRSVYPFLYRWRDNAWLWHDQGSEVVNLTTYVREQF